MTTKILKAILSIAILVLLSSYIIITVLLYQDYSKMLHSQLTDELAFVAVATEKLGVDYLSDLPDEGYRLTWIKQNGDVLFDNKADTQSMENHLNREEIQEAIKDGFGRSSRYSSTLTEKQVYEAMRLKDGSILRISISGNSIIAFIYNTLYPIEFILVISVLLSIYLAQRMAKQIVEPINTLNLDTPLENNTYDELSPLLHRLNKQHIEIENQFQLLKQKQREFDLTTKNMKEALVLLDVNQNIISINPSAIQLFAIPENYDASYFHDLSFYPNLKNAVDEAKLHTRSEFTDILQEKVYMFNISLIQSENIPHGIVILAFDITEQANAEQMRRDFTSNVSHELKTPLQSIIGSVELIENGIVKEEDMPRFTGHIRKEATRLLTLIEDIILLSQIDASTKMPTETVSLAAITKEILETLQFKIQDKKLKVTLYGSEGSIVGVRNLLYELVYNLIDNAIRYNIENGFIDIYINENQNDVILSVKDSGIGIPEEHQSKIFERFYRVDKSHSRKSGGTGLGLSIVKNAVKYHNGSITLDSAANKGTTIQVTLKKPTHIE